MVEIRVKWVLQLLEVRFKLSISYFNLSLICSIGESDGTVEYTGADTFFGKTASLLQGTNEYSNLQKMMIHVIQVLVVISSVLCLIVLIYLSTVTVFKEGKSFFLV